MSHVWKPLWAVQAAAFWFSWRRYCALPKIASVPEATSAAAGLGRVAVVIPARNEARRIPDLLRSLQDTEYADLQVLVVDDESSDATGEVGRDLGFTTTRSGGPPEGWTGKSWSCWLGTQQTTGTWIVFVDCDVVLQPEAIRTLVAEASEGGYDLFSVFPRHRCESGWERLLLPFAYALYFVGGGGRRSNSSGSTALANGQLLLVSRDSYLQVGGHQAIGGSIIDDVALARLFVTHGYRVGVARGEALGTVRMYDSLGSIREGFGKNAAAFSAAAGWSGVRTVLLTVLAGSLAVRSARRRDREAALGVGVCGLALIPWYRHFGVRPGYAFLNPLAAVLFESIAVEGMVRRLTRRGRWRGRIVA